ncbi:MAG: hypothetical protein KBS62_03205 [Oscillospiraceae bacterium]|nr:hypothetical protein [Candidatus Ruminococcus equi]
MWLTDYVTKNSFSKDDASLGNVTSASNNEVSVGATNDRFNLCCVAPYGIAYVPKVGEKCVVLPTDDRDVCLGVVAQQRDLEPGELMLFSSGGATILLKNNGKVLINGQEVNS